MIDNKIDIDFKAFPTTRYQGSKRKMLPWLHETFKALKFETVLDGFGGSATVSYLLKKMGKSVTYNDKLRFNYLIGKTLIENKNVTLKDKDFDDLLGTNSYVTYKDIIQKNFKDIYYLPQENEWLDHVVSNIVQMNHYTGKVLEYKKAIAFYALFQSSIIKRPFNLFHRSNLYIRTNDVTRNFGNKTTWDKSFDYFLHKFKDEANSLVFDSGFQCQALNKSIFEIENNTYDLVYLDPPYLRKDGTNETSNYLKCYHFLEGMSNYDHWKNSIDYETKNRRFLNSESDNDFNKGNIYTTFEALIDKFKDSIIVLSYKKGGMPSIDFLVDLMKRHKKKVTTRSMQYNYALNRQNGNAKKNREVLIVGI